ncbi:MAG: hypothetical protein ACTTKH_02330 [Treponema sp.]
MDEDDMDDMDMEEKTSNSSSANWDNILDSYEKIIDSQIDILKKVKDGDTMAAMEQAENLNKISDLAKQLEGSTSMSSSQLKRFNALQQKYANAMMQ